jgi:glutamine amidotransferase
VSEAGEVVIIDSGGANLASLRYALDRLGARAEVTASAAHIAAAPRVILPGVGAAADAMERLRREGLVDLVPRLTQPVLGICLGMQLLFARSEEGPTDCLGVLPETVARMPGSPRLPVPHMGWNLCRAVHEDPLFAGLGDGEYFYFVHSYAAPVTGATIATAEYGAPFAAAVRSGNFRGVQFHPERSARAGARLLANFLGLA